MAEAALIEARIAVAPMPKLGPGTYANAKPLNIQPSGRAINGGLLLAHAITAASETVRPEFYVYASQSSFLRPVTTKTQDRIIYRVENTTDGRTFATRVVRATHGAAEPCVYVAIISFQSGNVPPTDNVLEYGIPMPDLDGFQPDDIPEGLSRQLVSASSTPGTKFQPFDPEGDPFDWRPFGRVLTDQPSECRIRSFVRSPPLSTGSVSVSLAALAYMSDQILLGIPLYANPDKAGARSQNLAMAATLSHNISFQDPGAKADQWMVSQRETSWGADGRVLIHQRLWSLNTGGLVMTCTQEGLIRLKEAKL